MRRVIEGLKEQRNEAEKTFIMNCLAKRASPVKSIGYDTESYLDVIRELSKAIRVLENDTIENQLKQER
tara:strand:- start:284 stop:490 length:207 start_codon:yes stop_codon:yes gene_type:complete